MREVSVDVRIDIVQEHLTLALNEYFAEAGEDVQIAVKNAIESFDLQSAVNRVIEVHLHRTIEDAIKRYFYEDEPRSILKRAVSNAFAEVKGWNEEEKK